MDSPNSLFFSAEMVGGPCLRWPGDRSVVKLEVSEEAKASVPDFPKGFWVLQGFSESFLHFELKVSNWWPQSGYLV